MISTEGIDYVITDDKIRFESYLSTYGHLNASQVTEFSRRPPVITECVDIAIVDDDILEQVKSKEFSVFFSSDSLSSDRLLIESGVRITIHDNDSEPTVCLFSWCVCANKSSVCVYVGQIITL